MVRFDPADAFDDEIPAADPRGAGAGRRAEAALAPARRAAFRAGQPTVGTSISVLGAAADNRRCRRRRGLRGGFLRRRRPRFVGSNSSPRSAVRRRAAPAPRPARRHRLRRAWRAIARILPRCATPNISRRLGRKPAPPGASIACGAFRLAALAARRADAANRRRSSRPFGRRRASRGSPTPCGTSWPTPKLRSRRPRARAPRR